MIQKPKGTRDLIEDIKYYQFLKKTFFKMMSLYNFQEIETPIFEFKKLFLNSISESEIVNKQMFEFNDRKQREMVLRPENTAGIMRAYNEAKIYQPKRLTKWCYFGPMFRYERPQLGRYRQFYQFGGEIIGDKNFESDVVIILVVMNILKKLKINNTTLHINFLGSNKEREKYVLALKDFFQKHKEKICLDCQNRFNSNKVLRILDCKLEMCKLENTPLITSYLTEENLNHYESIQKKLENLGIKFVKNPFLVRGLDYYSDLVFEVIPNNNNKSQSSIVGGGRYETLSQKIGGINVSGIGFAFGVERIINLLIEKKENLNLEKPLDVLIVYDGMELDDITIIAQTLRDNEISCDYNKFNVVFKKQFKMIKYDKVLYILKVKKDNNNSSFLLVNEKTKQEYKGENISLIISRIKDEKNKRHENDLSNT